MRHQPARVQKRAQEIGYRFAWNACAVRKPHLGGVEHERCARTIGQRVGVAAHQHRQPDVDRIAIEETGKRLRQHRRHAKMLQGLGPLLAR